MADSNGLRVNASSSKRSTGSVFHDMVGSTLETIETPTAMIVDEHSFQNYLSSGKVAFAGSGATKLKSIIKSDNAVWPDQIFNVSFIADMVHQKFMVKAFADLAYTEPFYVKEFYTKTTI